MTDLHTLYLPVAMNTAPPAYGVQVDGALTIPVVPNRIYHTGARWMGVDPWLADNISAFDPNPVIIGTKTCPVEYRLYADRMGSEPKPEYYPCYVDFVRDLCTRYHPYAFEVWNEPDTPTYSAPADQQYYYGAWVTNEDYYAAGVRYGNLLAQVYPVLHDMGVQVLGGALMNGHVVQGREFLRGMLETGLCDYVSFHVYPYYPCDYKQVVYDAIGSIMSVTHKPLFISETSLLTRGEDTAAFRAAQAEYLAWFRDYMAWNGTPWLHYAADNDWFHCGLVRNGVYTPAWEAWCE